MPDSPAALLTHIGVYGGGRMGAGIAHTFLAAGCQVVVIEGDERAALAARERVVSSLGKAAERGALSVTVDEAAARLTTTTDANDLARVELVVEAVPEDAALKLAVFQRVEQVAPDAVLATNTSSLSIDSIAASLNAPSASSVCTSSTPSPPATCRGRGR